MKIDKKKVKIIMANQGTNAKIIADRMKICPQALSILWNGKHESRVDTLHKLADALRVRVEEILA